MDCCQLKIKVDLYPNCWNQLISWQQLQRKAFKFLYKKNNETFKIPTIESIKKGGKSPALTRKLNCLLAVVELLMFCLHLKCFSHQQLNVCLCFGVCVCVYVWACMYVNEQFFYRMKPQNVKCQTDTAYMRTNCLYCTMLYIYNKPVYSDVKMAIEFNSAPWFASKSPAFSFHKKMATLQNEHLPRICDMVWMQDLHIQSNVKITWESPYSVLKWNINMI